MLGQVQAAFAQLHNATLQELHAKDHRAAFKEARRLIVREFHRLIAHDLLPRMVGNSRIRQVKRSRAGLPLMTTVPKEFSLAVGQVGHAMVKPRYRINDSFQAVLFQPQSTTTPRRDLRGQPLDEHDAIDWGQFFPIGNPMTVQRASKLNAKICSPLFEVPGVRGTDRVSLPYLALEAADRAGLPSGESIAKRLGYDPLPRDVVWNGMPCSSADSPLWFYVLREAEVQQSGRRLGDVGGWVFARVVLDALPSSSVGATKDDAATKLTELRTAGETLGAAALGRSVLA